MANGDKETEVLGPATITDPLIQLAAGDRFGRLDFSRQFLAEYMERVNRHLGFINEMPRDEWHEALRRIIDEYASAITGHDDRYPIIKGWHDNAMFDAIIENIPYKSDYDWMALMEKRGWPLRHWWAWFMLEWLAATWMSALSASFGDMDVAGEYFAEPFDMATHIVNGSFEAWEAAHNARSKG